MAVDLGRGNMEGGLRLWTFLGNEGTSILGAKLHDYFTNIPNCKRQDWFTTTRNLDHVTKFSDSTGDHAIVSQGNTDFIQELISSHCLMSVSVNNKQQTSDLSMLTMCSSRQIADCIVQTNPGTGQLIESNLQSFMEDSDQTESPLLLKLETSDQPLVNNNVIKQTMGEQYTNLVVPLKFVRAKTSQIKNTDLIQQFIVNKKSELFEDLGVACTCLYEDNTTSDHVDHKVVHGIFRTGEKEILDLFRQKLVDVETLIFNNTGRIVSVVEGSIEIKLNIQSTEQLDKIYDDIKSGMLLHRIIVFLKQHDYQFPTAAIFLSVDVNEINKIRENLVAKEKECQEKGILPFTVNYTFCPENDTWFWSPDNLHWMPCTQRKVTAGKYEGLHPVEVDNMILDELVNGNVKNPSPTPGLCLVCSPDPEKDRVERAPSPPSIEITQINLPKTKRDEEDPSQKSEASGQVGEMDSSPPEDTVLDSGIKITMKTRVLSTEKSSEQATGLTIAMSSEQAPEVTGLTTEKSSEQAPEVTGLTTEMSSEQAPEVTGLTTEMSTEQAPEVTGLTTEMSSEQNLGSEEVKVSGEITDQSSEDM